VKVIKQAIIEPIKTFVMLCYALPCIWSSIYQMHFHGHLHPGKLIHHILCSENRLTPWNNTSHCNHSHL